MEQTKTNALAPTCPRLQGRHCSCTAYCAEYFKAQPGHKPENGPMLDLADDTPLQAPACSLDGGPCESCQ